MKKILFYFDKPSLAKAHLSHIEKMAQRQGLELEYFSDQKKALDRFKTIDPNIEHVLVFLINSHIPFYFDLSHAFHRQSPLTYLLFLEDTQTESQLKEKLKFASPIGRHWSFTSKDHIESALKKARLSTRQRIKYVTSLATVRKTISQIKTAEKGTLQKYLMSDIFLVNILQKSSDAIFTYDMSGMILSWNKGAQTLYGYTENEMIGKKVELLTPNEKKQDELEDLKRLKYGQVRDSYTAQRITNQGNVIDVSITITPIKDANSNVIGASVIQRDITGEIKHQKMLSSVIEAAPNGMLMVGKDGNIKLINKAIEQMFGYEREALLGKPVELLVPNQFRVKHPGFREGFFNNPSARKMGVGRDLKGQKKDGSLFSIEIGLNPIETPEGLMVLSSIIDITDRIDLYKVELNVATANARAEVNAERSEELNKAYQYIDNIIKSMLDTVLVLTPQGVIEKTNPALLNLLNYQEPELLGKPMSIILAEEEEGPFGHNRLKKLLAKGAVSNLELSFKTKKGEKIPMSFVGSVMQDKQNQITGIVGVARDMREIKRLMVQQKKAAQAEQLIKQKKELEHTQEGMLYMLESIQRREKELKATQAQLIQAGKMTAMGEFVFGVAHEVNNPLSGSLGIIDNFLRKLKKTDPNYEGMSIAKEGMVRATSLIKELLEFSRPESASMKPLDIHACIDDALLFVGKRFTEQSVAVQKEYQKALPPVMGNSKKLQQVFLNLISNSLDAILDKNQGDTSQGGSLNISTRRKGDHILVVFSDSGCGIKKDFIGQIFNPFHTTKSPGKGTGLGLSISHTIITAHGGKIEVKSESGKGSSFEIYLPIKKTIEQRRVA